LFNLQNYSTQNIKNDVLSGALVAVALVPEAIAFSFIAGVFNFYLNFAKN
jgi:SulP family sulfate permease